jgi:hypothetical protein
LLAAGGWNGSAGGTPAPQDAVPFVVQASRLHISACQCEAEWVVYPKSEIRNPKFSRNTHRPYILEKV